MAINYMQGYGVTEEEKERIDKADFEMGIRCFGEKYGFRDRIEHEGYGEIFPIEEVGGLRIIGDIAKKHAGFYNEITELGREANINSMLDTALEDEKFCRVLLDIIRRKALTDAAFYYGISSAEFNYCNSLE